MADLHLLPNGSWSRTGGHNLNDPNLRIVPGTVPVQNPNGTLTAQVEMQLPTGAWAPKRNNPTSTIFDPSWSEAIIENEISRAFADDHAPGNFIAYTGMSPSGFPIRFRYDANLKTWRLFPKPNQEQEMKLLASYTKDLHRVYGGWSIKIMAPTGIDDRTTDLIWCRLIGDWFEIDHTRTNDILRPPHASVPMNIT